MVRTTKEAALHPDRPPRDPKVTKKPENPSKERQPSVKPSPAPQRSGDKKRGDPRPDREEVEGEKTIETGETPDDQHI